MLASVHYIGLRKTDRSASGLNLNSWPLNWSLSTACNLLLFPKMFHSPILFLKPPYISYPIFTLSWHCFTNIIEAPPKRLSTCSRHRIYPSIPTCFHEWSICLRQPFYLCPRSQYLPFLKDNSLFCFVGFPTLLICVHMYTDMLSPAFKKHFLDPIFSYCPFTEKLEWVG